MSGLMTDNADAEVLLWFTQHYASTSTGSTKRPLQQRENDRPPKRSKVDLETLNSRSLAKENTETSAKSEVISLLSDEEPDRSDRPLRQQNARQSGGSFIFANGNNSVKQDTPRQINTTNRLGFSCFPSLQVQKQARPQVRSLLGNKEDYLHKHQTPQPLPFSNPHGFRSSQLHKQRRHFDSQRNVAQRLYQPSQKMVELKKVPDRMNHRTSQVPAEQWAGEKQILATGPELSSEQSSVVELVMSGKNVFFTGSAGTGKSTVLKEFVKRLQAKGKEVNIIAPTGRAALDINGSTTWTYAGWNPDSMKKPLAELQKAAHGKFVSGRLRKTRVLVIDEISMVENFHFERLNTIMKEARGSDKPFGGVQLVVTGDFCQLPPVKPFTSCLTCGRELAPLESGTVFRCPEHGQYLDIDKWAFRSAAWKECKFRHVHLSQIHRQSDEIFIRILQKCRIGVPLSDDDKDLLLNHKSETKNAVKLFATRAEVGQINQIEFLKLKTPKITYLCYDYFQWNQEKHRHLESKGRKLYDGSLEGLKDHRYEPKLDLKVGMLVVLLANLDINGGLVNGSQGVIMGFQRHQESDLPHSKSNEMRLKSNSAANQSGEYAGLKDSAVRTFVDRAAVKEWPIVRFTNGAERAIVADCTVNELGDEKPYSLLSRTQIPLTAAWAMSIHKAQGMTLDRVVVDLSKSFEEGQMYVALSRARTLEGLKVEGLGNWQGQGNAQVKEFLHDKFGI